MKNKFIIFYTFFASVAFAFSVVFFAVNIYKEYSQGQARANQRHNKLVNDLKTYASVDRQFTQNSIENIKNTIGDFNDFSFIQLFLDDAEILKYPKDATADLTVSNLTKSFDANFSTQNGQIKIICNVYLLRPSSIYYYAKISFLIILIVTIITVILIFYANSKENRISENDENDYEAENDDVFNDEIAKNEEKNERAPIFSVDSLSAEENPIRNETDSENANINSPDFSETDETENSQNDENSVATTENHDFKENDNSPQYDFQNEKKSFENRNAQKVELPNFETPMKLEQNDENNPTGLFNPSTGLGWESYLQTRLENEISRAISSEIDLAIFLIQLPQTQRESQKMKNASEYLALQFQFKDLLFEYNENSIAAIKISMNLDEALNFADKIYSELAKIADGEECFIGISTRNIRIVSAERLISEAQAALKHAKEDGDSPIIAFRVDAGKYRQYMEQN